ncbi:MAG TPA: delta-60 repeat domain-containing protein, partial [Verrucomicrobiae bacterium]|nr:delta-60 repeat domain-containing protein [Verrucomicrobiae bacterium]
MKIPNLSALPVTVPTNPAFSRRKHVIFTLATGLLFYASPFAPLRGQPLLDAFNPNVTGGLIRTIAAQPDGKIVIGGNFTTVGTTARTRLARLNANGSLDTTFPNTVANGEVFSLALQADGKIVVGGAFSTLGGQPHSFLGRLNSDGTLDNAFTVGANDWVRAVAVQIDGKILVGGAFTNLAGQSRPYLGRVNADGTLDSFNPQADNQVNTISVQTDGTIVVGGFFTALGGQPRNRLGQLTSAGGVILDFDPNVNGAVWSLALDRNSGIIVGGLFTSVQTQPRTNLARLFLSGSVDSTFKPPTDSTVASLAVQPDGKIVAGGNFTNLFGQTNKFIGRLNADGSVDTTFTNLGANATVYSLATQPDGKILAGGGFTTLGGQTRNGMARFGQSLASPANDAFASATVLQLANRSLSFSGSNLGATFETGESNFLASAFGGRSVWYSYTPSEQGLLRVLLTSPTCCQNESAYSLLVARGSSAANLTAVTVPILIDNGALFTRTRAAYADVLQGLDHRIVVDGGFWNGIFVGSNFNVSLQLFPSPTNDNFQQRYHIPGRSYATPISLLAASREPGEPSHGGGAGSLWWDWTAPFTGLVTLRGTQAGNFVPFLAVYQGAVLASLASAPSSSQVIGQTRQLRFQATQGQNYDLALAGAKFDTNDFPHISDALFSSGKFEFSFATLAIQMTSLSATTNST